MSHTELQRFETHSRVFEQISQFLTLLSTASQLYIAVTGGLWLAVGGGPFQFQLAAKLAVLTFHVFASAIVALLMFKIAASVEQRAEFLKRMGERYWPEIEDLGHAVASGSTSDKDVKPGRRTKAWRWGALRQTARLWASVPIGGAVGSLALAGLVGWSDWSRAPACANLRSELWSAPDPVRLDRAKYLLDKLGCAGPELGRRPPADRPRVSAASPGNR